MFCNFVDFEKVFDTVLHNELLPECGFNGSFCCMLYLLYNWTTQNASILMVTCCHGSMSLQELSKVTLTPEEENGGENGEGDSLAILIRC